MKAAVLVFSPQGAELAARHLSEYDLYGKNFGNNVSKEDFEAIFNTYDRIIFIGAVGIAVRYLAPVLRDKRKDPAVVVIDPTGQYVISVLSGHLGGANDFAREIAAIIGAVPIITTASDHLGYTSIDLFAKENNYVIADMKRMKEIAAAMVSGEPVYFYSERNVRPDYPHIVQAHSIEEALERKGIVVSYDALCMDDGLQLIPKVLHLGIGSKKGTKVEDLTALVEKTFVENGWDLRAISVAHTIDIKGDEESIKTFCKAAAIPLNVYDAKTLSKKESFCGGSDFVKQTVGVKAVSCPAALMGGDRLLVEKVSSSGLTLSVTEEIK